MKVFKNILREIYMFCIRIVSATKNTEVQVLTQNGADSANGGISVVQDVNQGAHALSRALLRGELTEEVKQLRYRNYKVDREAKKYKYFVPTLAIKKKEGKDYKFISYDKSDGLDVITIQYNYPISEDVLDGINQIDNGGRGGETKYKIEITRGFRPRFRMEEFLRKVVVKRLDEKHAILDFYFSKYPDSLFRTSDDKSFRSKPFIHEIERIKNEGLKSDITEIEQVRFVTKNAYHVDDLFEYVFDNIFLREVSEFDGDYILRFKAAIVHDGIDLTAAYYNKEMDEKYRNKEKKELVLDTSGEVPVETYVCSDCGKVVTFDVRKIDEMPVSEAREIDEEVDEEGSWNVLEYMDMQLVEQTIGKKLCKDCLKKYIDNRGMEFK